MVRGGDKRSGPQLALALGGFPGEKVAPARAGSLELARRGFLESLRN